VCLFGSKGQKRRTMNLVVHKPKSERPPYRKRLQKPEYSVSANRTDYLRAKTDRYANAASSLCNCNALAKLADE
jgi:ribulose bisphosphate carboxylase small subunit